MGDSQLQTAKGGQEGALPAAMRDKLDTAARNFADEVVNSDYSQSKYLPEQVRKYESDQHLSGAASDYLARRIGEDNYADRLNAQQKAQQAPAQTHWYDWFKRPASNDQLEKDKILPKVVLGGASGHTEISGVIADAPYEHAQPGQAAPATAPKPAEAPRRNPDAGYSNNAISAEHVFTDTLNLNKK